MMRFVLADQLCSLFLQLGGELLLGQEGPLCLGEFGVLSTPELHDHIVTLVGSNHETELVTGVNWMT